MKMKAKMILLINLEKNFLIVQFLFLIKGKKILSDTNVQLERYKKVLRRKKNAGKEKNKSK